MEERWELPGKLGENIKTESAFTLVARDTLYKNPKCLINSSQEKQNSPKKKKRNGYFSLNIGQLEFYTLCFCMY